MPMKQEKDLQLNNKKKNPAPRKKNSGAAAGKVRKALKPSEERRKRRETTLLRIRSPINRRGSKAGKIKEDPSGNPVPSGKESEQVQRKEPETGSPERVLPHHPVGGYEGNRKEHHGNRVSG